MISTLVLLAAGLGPAPTDCSLCKPDPKRTVLCEEHEKEERAVLREYKSDLRSKQVGIAQTAMKEVAGLTKSHANAPSPKVAELLSKNLEHRSSQVRRSAFDHLLEGQHPDVVVESLSELVVESEKPWKKARQAFMDWAADGTPRWDPEESREFDDHFQKAALAHSAIRAVGQLPDDRSVEALVDVLERSPKETPGSFYVAAAEGLAALGSREGMVETADLLARLDKVIGKLEGFPRSGGGLRLGDAMIRVYEVTSPDDYAAIAGALRSAAEQRGLLDGAPDTIVGAGSAWRDWVAGNEASFSESLGTLTEPVRVELKDEDD